MYTSGQRHNPVATHAHPDAQRCPTRRGTPCSSALSVPHRQGAARHAVSSVSRQHRRRCARPQSRLRQSLLDGELDIGPHERVARANGVHVDAVAGPGETGREVRTVSDEGRMPG